MRTTIFATLLLALCAGSSASAQTKVGPWIVGEISDKTGMYASTMNDSGALFGKYCYGSSANCMWLMANSASCDEGSQYPVLINSDNGAAATHVICRPVDGTNRYIFSDHNLVDDAVLQGKRIGFAFPMADGRFQVTRFEVGQAVAAMSALIAAMRKPPQRRTPSTKDFSL